MTTGKPERPARTLGLLLIASSLWAGGAVAEGVYRPVEGEQAGRHAQGQFAPVEERGVRRWSPSQNLPSPALPPTPQAGPGYNGYPQGSYPGYPQAGYGGYAPPGYGRTPLPAPGYDGGRGYGFPVPGPGGFMDNFFGGRNDALPETYLPPPVPPLAAPVAPVYNPPIPQPAPPVPAYGNAEPAQAVDPQPPARQQAETRREVKAAPRPASPRPFANPRETGNAFPLRSSVQAGRSDPRFRPPELKGTP